MSTEQSAKRLPIFVSTTLFFWFALYTYPVLLSDHVQTALGGTPAFAGLIVGSYGFSQMLVRIPLGLWSDRMRRRKPLVILGRGLALVSALMLAFAKSPFTALMGRTAAGGLNYTTGYRAVFLFAAICAGVGAGLCFFIDTKTLHSPKG